MDLLLTDDERAFRDRVRAWLETHVPGEPRPLGDLAAGREFDVAWQRELAAAGYAGLSWPREYGGAGLSPVEELIFHVESAAAGAPDLGTLFVGLAHAGPTLIHAGSPEIQRQFLPRILSGEDIWCQGFSEPGAGSDLAAIRTKGVVDGSVLVVTGQKIWTSYAQVADRQELLVRTDPEAPRHQGLSWVVADMDTPGIEVRPIRTAADDHHLCEVFYDEARIPLERVVGDLNNGWRTAMTTLSFERGTAFLAEQVRLRQRVAGLAEYVDHPGAPPDAAARWARASAAADALFAMSLRSISEVRRMGQPGPAASMVKLATADAERVVGELQMDLLGPDAVWVNELSRGWREQFAYIFGGGTPEIQRNLIGERMLGLPRN
ncbi:MAG: acyl-CoA dehydrogenase family protein [Acidimicrobiia bacterium]|nr:acyl-CoA dehydrogenase family protein [Acidimicrobiia bacterium]